LGRGRAAVVFRSLDDQGRTTARKVFDSGPLTCLIQYTFLGAPNPYAWCEHAVQAAILRRRILAPLVRHWFGDRLQVSEGWNVDWNRDLNAWQLHTRFIDGRPPYLHQPLSQSGEGEVRELVTEILEPLQQHLIEAGFDGQVWQAGLGNPVALTNFLRVTTGARATWAWIDLESGVPALFPAHLPSLWRFYLPRALRYGRPLFDDVDVPKLGQWLGERRMELARTLDPATLEGIERDVAALGYHQERWRGMSRFERSLNSQHAKGRIDAAGRAYFSKRPLRWYLHEAARAGRGVSRRLGHKVSKAFKRCMAFPWQKLVAGTGSFILSSRFRARSAQQFVEARVKRWQVRGQLSARDAELITNNRGRHESSVYLADFAVHLCIKPLVKSFEYIIAPALLAAGTIDEVTLGLIWLSGGSVGRTLYTGGRVVQNFLSGRELPMTSFWVGLLPVIGNLAFPLQIVRSSKEKDDLMARFILYDGFAAIGRKCPIWGGRDTLTEHRFNRVPDRMIPRGGHRN